jgi:hypothetical protein
MNPFIGPSIMIGLPLLGLALRLIADRMKVEGWRTEQKLADVR